METIIQFIAFVAISMLNMWLAFKGGIYYGRAFERKRQVKHLEDVQGEEK